MVTYVEPKIEIISDEEDSNLVAITNIDDNDIIIKNEVLHCPNDEKNGKTETETNDKEEQNSQILTYYENDSGDEQISFPEKTLQETFSSENPYTCEKLQTGELTSSKNNMCKIKHEKSLQENLTHSSGNPTNTTCQTLNQKITISRESGSNKSNMANNADKICKICNKEFKYISKLKIHEITHTGEKRFRCDVCEKKYTQKHNLIIHQRIHTGEKPYLCQVCDKKFSQKLSLNCHLRIHTGEKPYRCETCNKSFSERCNLTKHLRTHTNDKSSDEHDVKSSYKP